MRVWRGYLEERENVIVSGKSSVYRHCLAGKSGDAVGVGG